MNLKVKQQIGLMFTAMLPILMFFVLFLGTLNIVLGLMGGILGILPAILVGKSFLRGPMDDLINGKPVAFDLNSSGMMQAYSVQLDLPKMSVNLGSGKVIETKFDRKLAIPFNLLMKKRLITWDEEDNIVFKGEKIDSLANKKFILNKQATVFIINSQTMSFITKEELANKENRLATENLTLYELELMKNMSRDIRLLGKTFMANLGGQKILEILSNPLVQAIILIAVIGLIGILVGPMVLDALGIGSSAAGFSLPGIPVSR
jgi:hypothetical protein